MQAGKDFDKLPPKLRDKLQEVLMARTSRYGSLLLCLTVLLVVLLAPQAVSGDPWTQVVGDGFGDRTNLGISTFHVFQGQLVAATNQSDNSGGTVVLGSGPTQLWRSSDGVRWSQVTSFSPPLQASAHGVFHMADSGSTAPQYVYLLTANAGPQGPGVYRSTDGTAWTQINGPGSGFDRTGNNSMAGLALKRTGGTLFLYAGTQNNAGAQIWRVPFDATSGWQKVFDFGAVDRSVTVVTYLFAWKDTLYAGTLSGSTGAHIYTSSTGDSGSWVKTPGVGDGFGDVRNTNVAGIVDFNGYLYVSTQNRRTGGQLWRSADGQIWQRVVGDGFGNPLNQELHRLRVAQGQLWVTTFTESPGSAQVWRSSDGLTFVQSNPDGFGDPDTRTGFPDLVEFLCNVFWGGQNKVTGGQIWRTSLPCAEVTLSASQFRPGQRITIGLNVRNPTLAPAAELYVGVLLPDGRTLVFLSDRGTLAGTASLTAPATFPRTLVALPGLGLAAGMFFEFTFPAAGVPAGNYQVFAVLTREGALLDNRIDPDDIVALHIKPFRFSP